MQATRQTGSSTDREYIYTFTAESSFAARANNHRNNFHYRCARHAPLAVIGAPMLGTGAVDVAENPTP